MLRNYLKVALRNLWKSKGYSTINIIGLAAGLGVCLLIVLYVIDELSYDRWNRRIDATVNRYLGRQLQDLLHTSTEDLQRSGNHFKYEMIPLTEIHLHSNKSYEFEANGSITFVY